MTRSTDRKTAHGPVKSLLLWLIAALSSLAALFHAACAMVVVLATYFTAWATRMQHRLVTFFARYGAAAGDAGACDSAHGAREVSDAELELAQRSDSEQTACAWPAQAPAEQPQIGHADAGAYGAGDDAEHGTDRPGVFGTRPPRGSA